MTVAQVRRNAACTRMQQFQNSDAVRFRVGDGCNKQPCWQIRRSFLWDDEKFDAFM